jgi:hypothetical protein
LLAFTLSKLSLEHYTLQPYRLDTHKANNRRGEGGTLRDKERQGDIEGGVEKEGVR